MTRESLSKRHDKKKHARFFGAWGVLRMGDINRSGGKFPRHATTLCSKYVVPHISVMPKRHILSWYRLQDPANVHLLHWWVVVVPFAIDTGDVHFVVQSHQVGLVVDVQHRCFDVFDVRRLEAQDYHITIQKNVGKSTYNNKNRLKHYIVIDILGWCRPMVKDVVVVSVVDDKESSRF